MNSGGGNQHSKRVAWKIPTLVTLALIGATWLFYIADRTTEKIGAIETTLSTGRLYETHTQAGRPDIEIFMFGFVDAGFAAYVVEGKSRIKPFGSLPCTIGEIGATNQLPPIPNAALCQIAEDRIPVYQVAWSQDGKRFGLVVHGYFVAAYEITSGRRLVAMNVYSKEPTAEKRSGRIQRFVTTGSEDVPNQ